MTLILTCLTSEWAVQVSDRRLVGLRGGTVRVVDESSNKAIIYSDHFTVGYTGLARIGEESVDRWTAMHLASHPDLDTAVMGLADAASREFQRLTAFSRAQRRHSFVIAGFGYTDANSPAEPLLIRISNAQDKGGRWAAEAAESFSVQAFRANPTKELWLNITGQAIPRDLRVRLKRWLRRGVDRGAGPLAAARLLSHAVWIAAGTNRHIGRNRMIVGVVKNETPGEYHHVVNRAPWRHGPTFLYIPADGRPFPQLSPWVVYPGRMMGNLTVYASRPGPQPGSFRL
jgi:hypothetical protein